MEYDLMAIMEIQPMINMFRPLSIELDYTLSPRAKTLWTIIENSGYEESQISIPEIAAIFNITKSDAQTILDELIEYEAIEIRTDLDGDVWLKTDSAYVNEKSGEVEAVKARLSALYERQDRKNKQSEVL